MLELFFTIILKIRYNSVIFVQCLLRLLLMYLIIENNIKIIEYEEQLEKIVR